MEQVTVRDICAITGGRLISGSGDFAVCGFFTDSRKAPSGGRSMFVPLKGDNFDGHDYIADIAARGLGCGALVERARSAAAAASARAGFALIEVGDALCAMQALAAANRMRYGVPVIAVTGTVGKTTTKEFLRMAGGDGTVVSEASFNNHIGVPATLLNMDGNTRLCVAEIGMNAPGEISALSAIARPTIGIVTNVGPCHLQGLGSVENIAAEKACIVDGMEPGSKVLVNADNALALAAVSARALQKGVEVLTFGLGAGADFRAVPGDNGRFAVESRVLEAPVEVSISIPGRHNIMNALAAFAAAVLAGRDARAASSAMSGQTKAKLRWEKRELAGRTLVLDCYNANPLSVAAALETLESEFWHSRRVFVFGNMYELGKDEKSLHAELAGKIAETGVAMLITVGELAAEAGRAFSVCGSCDTGVCECDSLAEAAEAVIECTAPGDVVLIKGSRRNRMEDIVGMIEKACAEVPS